MFTEGSPLPCAAGRLVPDATSPAPTPPSTTKSPFCPGNAASLPPGLADGVPSACTPPCYMHTHSSWLVLDHRWAPLQPRRAPTPSSQSPQDPGALPVTAPSPAGGPVSTPSHAAGRHPPRDRTQVAAFENRAVGTCKRRLNRGPEWLNSAAFKAGKAIRKS